MEEQEYDIEMKAAYGEEMKRPFEIKYETQAMNRMRQLSMCQIDDDRIFVDYNTHGRIYKISNGVQLWRVPTDISVRNCIVVKNLLILGLESNDIESYDIDNKFELFQPIGNFGYRTRHFCYKNDKLIVSFFGDFQVIFKRGPDNKFEQLTSVTLFCESMMSFFLSDKQFITTQYTSVVRAYILKKNGREVLENGKFFKGLQINDAIKIGRQKKYVIIDWTNCAYIYWDLKKKRCYKILNRRRVFEDEVNKAVCGKRTAKYSRDFQSQPFIVAREELALVAINIMNKESKVLHKGKSEGMLNQKLLKLKGENNKGKYFTFTQDDQQNTVIQFDFDVDQF